jgi:hypothetical protein
MFDSILGSYYASAVIAALGKLPKEAVYAGAAYFTVTELFKRYAEMKIRIAEAETQAHVVELEVEKLRIQLAMREIGDNLGN